MRSLVVLMAVACAAQAHVVPLPLAYSAYSAPAAVSHQSRVDVVSSPAVAYAAPLAHVAPVAHVLPAAVSHQSRVDVHSSPYVSHGAYAHAPLHGYSAYASPLLHAAPYGHAW